MTPSCGGVPEVGAPPAVEVSAQCVHSQSWRTALAGSARSRVGAHTVDANVAVEEKVGWDRPQLWKSMHGGAPTAVEECMGWVDP